MLFTITAMHTGSDHKTIGTSVTTGSQALPPAQQFLIWFFCRRFLLPKIKARVPSVLIALSSRNFPLYFFSSSLYLGAYIWGGLYPGAYKQRACILGAYNRGAYIPRGLYPGAYIMGAYIRWAYNRGFYPGDFYPRAYIQGAYSREAYIRGLITGGLHPGLISGEIISRGLILDTDNF